MLVKRAEMSKDTSSSSCSMCTDLKYWLKPLLSLTNEWVIPVYFCSIFVRNLANLYVAVPKGETMGHMGN